MTTEKKKMFLLTIKKLVKVTVHFWELKLAKVVKDDEAQLRPKARVNLQAWQKKCSVQSSISENELKLAKVVKEDEA